MRAGGAADFLAGAALLTLVLAPCAAAGTVVVRRRLGHLRGIVRALAVFTAVSAAVWAAHVVPLGLGVLSPWSAALAAGLLLAGALRLSPVPAEPPAPAPDALPSRLMALAGAGGVSVAAVALLLARDPSPAAVDAMANHLPQVARWVQTGSMWELTAYAAYLSHATYPQNGTVLMLAASLPWSSTFATGYVGAPFMAATAVAVYALAREIGAPASSGVLAGAAVAALPAVGPPALGHVMLDAPMLAWFAAGALFLLRSARSGDGRELLLAGCALGLSFGTKWYAVAYVPVLCVAWLVARRRAGARVLPEAARLTAAIGLFGGIWLVRNWVLAGNPLHPLRVAPFGIEIFDAPRDIIREFFGFTVSDYLLDGRVWQEDLLPAFAGAFGLLGPLLIATTLAAAGLAWRHRGDPHTGAVAAAAAAGLVIGILYTVTPDTAFGALGEPFLVEANARYLVPALLGGAALAAWVAGRCGRARWLLELLLLVALLEALRRWDAGIRPVHLLLAAGIVALAGAASVLVRPRPPIVAAVCAAFLLGGGWGLWRADAWTDYARVDPAIAELQRLAPGERRVAIVGMWPGSASPALAAYGRRLDNRVDYIGYFAGGTRLPTDDRATFERQVLAGRYDVVVVGQGPDGQEGNPKEAPWVRELGYAVRASTTQFVLLTRRP